MYKFRCVRYTNEKRLKLSLSTLLISARYILQVDSLALDR